MRLTFNTVNRTLTCVVSQQMRDRNANLRDEEMRRLLQGISQEKEAINCLLQYTMTARRRKVSWERVRLRVNAVSVGAARSLEKIMEGVWHWLWDGNQTLTFS